MKIMSVLNSICKRILVLLIALVLSSCLKDNELNSPEIVAIEGRWQLQQVSCYCYFEDYDFTTNELWVSAKSSVMLSRNQNGQPLGISDNEICLLYTSPSPRDRTRSRMPSSA